MSPLSKLSLCCWVFDTLMFCPNYLSILLLLKRWWCCCWHLRCWRQILFGWNLSPQKELTFTLYKKHLKKVTTLVLPLCLQYRCFVVSQQWHAQSCSQYICCGHGVDINATACLSYTTESHVCERLIPSVTYFVELQRGVMQITNKLTTLTENSKHCQTHDSILHPPLW